MDLTYFIFHIGKIKSNQRHRDQHKMLQDMEQQMRSEKRQTYEIEVMPIIIWLQLDKVV